MSAKRIEYHQGAIADVKSAVTWYRNRSPKAAQDFIAELQRAADTIREAPERWPPDQEQYPPIPAVAISFLDSLFRGKSVITIWAVAHGSRRPEFWTGRL